MPKPASEVTCYIPTDLTRRFRERFPMRTALSWVLRTAVEELMLATDNQPTTESLVKDAMRLAVIRQRKLNKAQANDSTTGATTPPAEPAVSITVERTT